MESAPQGIPNLPDITQVPQILNLGGQLLSTWLLLATIVGAFGIVLAVLNWSAWGDTRSRVVWRRWFGHYQQLLPILLHLLLVLALLTGGFLLCSTLANRYHYWEQSKISRDVAQVTGDRLEQTAPQVRYVVTENYIEERVIENNVVIKQQKSRDVDKFLELTASQIQVEIDRAIDPQTKQLIYSSNYKAEYSFVNNLTKQEDFFLEARPPSGFRVLSGFIVERNGQRQFSSSGYSFPFKLKPSQEVKFRVSYQAQSAPRWVYSAQDRSLSGLRLDIITNFPEVEFAGGIVPTEVKPEGNGTRFAWVYNFNVSALNPFGVFTGVGKVTNTGILPRLLILAPAVWLWWMLLLYLSVPLTFRDVSIGAGIFFACILALTYLSRFWFSWAVWLGLGLILLALTSKMAGKKTLGCTLAGAFLPIMALLSTFTGLGLAIAGLLSVSWLAWQGQKSD